MMGVAAAKRGTHYRAPGSSEVAVNAAYSYTRRTFRGLSLCVRLARRWLVLIGNESNLHSAGSMGWPFSTSAKI